MSLLKKSAAIPKKDFVGILGLLKQVHQASTFDSLKSGLQSHLFPILNSPAKFVNWTNTDSYPSANFGTMETSVNRLEILKEEFTYCLLTREYGEQEACPFKDFYPETSNKSLLQTLSLFLHENPKYLGKDHPCFNCVQNAITRLNSPAPTSINQNHRIIPQRKPWTKRDLQILEFVWPYILRTLKIIHLEKSSTYYLATSKLLADVPTPIAVLTSDFFILYGNKAFVEVLPLTPGDKLPKAISDLLHKQTEKSPGPFNNPTVTLEFPFYTLNKGFFRLSFSRLDDEDEGRKGQWVLKMEPVEESGIRVNRQMDEKTLTAREKEICDLILEGKSTKEIASRLFISYHTTRNHLKNIHKKLDVRSRSELIAILNK